MKKVNYFLFSCLFIAVLATLFTVQNGISVPVRFTFNEPSVLFFPLIVTLSFVGGAVYSILATLVYGWAFAGQEKYVNDVQTGKASSARDLLPSSGDSVEKPGGRKGARGELKMSSEEIRTVFENISKPVVDRKSN